MNEANLLELLRDGVADQDIHDSLQSTGFAARAGSVREREAFVRRELKRVAAHRRTLCPLLEQYVGHVERILDAGCGTGAGTVAMATSHKLNPRRVVGVDANPEVLRACRARAFAYGLNATHVDFRYVPPGRTLPFDDGEMDLVVCVSVLEFITSKGGRSHFIRELQRVTRPGGHVFIATPSPFRLVELHSRRFLGDHVTRDGYPWASSPRYLKSMFSEWQVLELDAYFARVLGDKLKLPRVVCPPWIGKVVGRAARWQKVLARKPS